MHGQLKLRKNWGCELDQKKNPSKLFFEIADDPVCVVLIMVNWDFVETNGEGCTFFLFASSPDDLARLVRVRMIVKSSVDSIVWNI